MQGTNDAGSSHEMMMRSVQIICEKKDGSGNVKMHFKKHHLVTYALDPSNCLFEQVQRFTAFRGYWNRGLRTFTRPKDNCSELPETIEQDGDGGLLAACKTDCDHTLGYLFHSLWGLWKSHHSVNQQLHLIRGRAGCWLHPYIKEEYANAQEDRGRPSFYKSSPKTLSEELRDLHAI